MNCSSSTVQGSEYSKTSIAPILSGVLILRIFCSSIWYLPYLVVRPMQGSVCPTQRRGDMSPNS
ncbi:hypothetical protein BDV37DRAFT_262523 [Aspergillus pseudonomiae]|uniref:Uncharacterized protein n=1 Tax=Aspergillus pseudonomiae TaxID=1506151 RepID=A0A5N7CXS8_9EURO|nr:uncharacterized protein BDV37DRAFT_262523 [Aspergillus pseudonomiae]KAE8398749.1 hypothetical protein BDV37DRAFT_262523 [Aspergillus pseudonomiae]